MPTLPAIHKPQGFENPIIRPGHWSWDALDLFLPLDDLGRGSVRDLTRGQLHSINSATWSVAPTGPSVDFANNNAHYIDVSRNLVPYYVENNLPFTVVVNVTPDATANGEGDRILISTESATTDGWELTGSAPAEHSFILIILKGGTQHGARTNTSLTDGQRYSVAATVTWSGDTPTITMYLDGVATQTTVANSFGLGDVDTMYVGRRRASGGNTWDGRAHAIAVYGRVLNEAEIVEHALNPWLPVDVSQFRVPLGFVAAVGGGPTLSPIGMHRLMGVGR